VQLALADGVRLGDDGDDVDLGREEGGGVTGEIIVERLFLYSWFCILETPGPIGACDRAESMEISSKLQ